MHASYPILVDNIDNGDQFALMRAIAHIGHTARLYKSLERLLDRRALLMKRMTPNEPAARITNPNAQHRDFAARYTIRSHPRDRCGRATGNRRCRGKSYFANLRDVTEKISRECCVPRKIKIDGSPPRDAIARISRIPSEYSRHAPCVTRARRG